MLTVYSGYVKGCRKGRTIRKLMGGAGEVQKKYSRKGKLNEKKIHARQLILKNIHAMA